MTRRCARTIAPRVNYDEVHPLQVLQRDRWLVGLLNGCYKAGALVISGSVDNLERSMQSSIGREADRSQKRCAPACWPCPCEKIAIAPGSGSVTHSDLLLRAITGCSRPQGPELLSLGLQDERLVVVVNDVGAAVPHLLRRLSPIPIKCQMVGTERVAKPVSRPGFNSGTGLGSQHVLPELLLKEGNPDLAKPANLGAGPFPTVKAHTQGASQQTRNPVPWFRIQTLTNRIDFQSAPITVQLRMRL